MTVYFDNAATTRVCPEAAEKAYDIMTGLYGNPSSAHGIGRAAKAELMSARRSVASAIGASPEEIFFTSGGTESDNWAIFGVSSLRRHDGRHIISSMTEHDAIRRPLKKLESEGWDVTYLKPDSFGRIALQDVENALRDDTVLVSLMLVNNETGAVNPISDISRLLRIKKSKAILHTDAVQGFCKLPIFAPKLGADLITLSSHKIHGPKGAGALYIKKGLRLPPLIMGGGQEREFRSGTEAMPALCAFGKAAGLGKATLSESIAHIRSLRDHTAALLKDALPGTVFIGEGDAPHILSISLPGYKSEVLMNCLDADGICVSKSSACKKGARSHVLEAMGLPNDIIDGAIRISFCRYNTFEEAEYFVSSLKSAAERLIKTK